LPDRQTSFCDGTRLIGEYDLHRANDLYNRQGAYQGLVVQYAPRAEGKGEGQDDGQALRYSSDCKGATAVVKFPAS
jgi:hypothetical protein